MALKPCRECRKQVSTEAATCPHCGVPTPVPPKPARPSKPTHAGDSGPGDGRWVLVVVAAILTIIVGGAAGSAISDRAEEKENARRAAEIAVFERATFLADSSSAAAVIQDSRDASDAEIVETANFLRTHGRGDSVVFRRFADIQIQRADSLSRLREFIPGPVREIVATLDTALTARQEQRKAAILRRVDARDRETERAVAAAVREQMIRTRQTYATTIQRRFLDDGLDISATTHGRDHTTLRLDVGTGKYK